MNRNIILCGVGGQGILLAAKIIAEAAQASGLEVTTNEIHGMAQRGGSVTAQIRVGDSLHSPLIPEGACDLLGSLEASEALRWAHFLKKDGLAVVSAQKIVPVTVSTGAAVYPSDVETRLKNVFPALIFRDFEAEAAALGNVRMSNVIMVGCFSGRIPGIGINVWEEAVRRCVKPEFAENNVKAFQRGREL